MVWAYRNVWATGGAVASSPCGEALEGRMFSLVLSFAPKERTEQWEEIEACFVYPKSWRPSMTIKGRNSKHHRACTFGRVVTSFDEIKWTNSFASFSRVCERSALPHVPCSTSGRLSLTLSSVSSHLFANSYLSFILSNSLPTTFNLWLVGPKESIPFASSCKVPKSCSKPRALRLSLM